LTIGRVERDPTPSWDKLGPDNSLSMSGVAVGGLPQMDWVSGTTRLPDDVDWSTIRPDLMAVELVDFETTDIEEQLSDALADLTEIVEESEEKGFLAPTESARQLAEQLLISMFAISPRRFEVYPMPKGEIAIDGHDGYGRRIVVFCESGGGLRCLTNDNGKRDSYSGSNPQGTVGPFIREALEAFL
jgi:hypothetical protein